MKTREEIQERVDLLRMERMDLITKIQMARIESYRNDKDYVYALKTMLERKTQIVQEIQILSWVIL